ncbi:MAG TPA: metallophosphoesterase [Fimbriimonas sp.]
MTPTRRELLRWFGYGAATAVAPVSYGEFSSGWLEVERHTLRLPRWDAGGFKVALLSDFHTMDDHRLEIGERAIDLALLEKPDAILLGGDYVNLGDRRRLKLLARLLSGFERARCPVLAVLGNHDYWSEQAPKIMEVFRSSPVRLLRNEAVPMGGLVVCGIDDGINHKQDPAFVARYESRDSVVAIYHEPDFVGEVPANASLMLAGHTHGGQVCLPGGVPFHLPYGGRKYVAGFYPAATVPVYVTRGVGTVGPDWRLFCRPEVSVLTLEKASPSDVP